MEEDFWLLQWIENTDNANSQLPLQLTNSQSVTTIQVRGEHPVNEVKKGNVVGVISEDRDTYWLAQVIDSKDQDDLQLQYYKGNTFFNSLLIYKEKRGGKFSLSKKFGTITANNILLVFENEKMVFTKIKTLREKIKNKLTKELQIYC